MDQTRKEWDDLSEDAKVEEKKIELLKQSIDGLKKKRDEIVNKYYAEEDKYNDQLRLIKRIEWMAREKERLIKDDEWKKKREEEEKAKKPVNPYLEHIDTCDHLIVYCRKHGALEKKIAEKKPEVSAEEAKVIQEKIQKGGLKAMEDKKTKEEASKLVIGGKKKGKDRSERKAARAKLNTKPEEQKLPIDLGTLGLFDFIGVKPPILVKEIAATLDAIIDKRKHFEELGQKEAEKQAAEKAAEAKKEEKPAEKPAEAKPAETKTEEKPAEVKKSDAKPSNGASPPKPQKEQVKKL